MTGKVCSFELVVCVYVCFTARVHVSTVQWMAVRAVERGSRTSTFDCTWQGLLNLQPSGVCVCVHVYMHV